MSEGKQTRRYGRTESFVDVDRALGEYEGFDAVYCAYRYGLNDAQANL